MSKYPIPNGEKLLLSISVAQYLAKVSWNIKDTQHPNWLFFWNPEGKVTLIFQGEEYRITPDQAVLLPPYTRLSAYSETSFPHIYAHFHISSPFDQIKNQLLLLPSAPAAKFYREKRFLPPKWRSSTYWELLIYEYLLMLPPEVFEPKEERKIDERIARAAEYCEKHFPESFGNELLAREAGMSVNNLYRLFQQDLGVTPKKYRENLRLEFARKMLLETDASIPHIAIHCGYADRYQFSKAFKKCFGLTPAAIRHEQS